MEDEARIQSIVNVDTHALLRTLKDLETRLSDSYRQDVIPPWAASLIPRLEKLESQFGKLSAAELGLSNANTSSSSGSGTFEDITRDDRILNTVRSEMEAQNGAIRLGLESKVASLSMELDRVRKLLEIRPTTSELQRVIVAVNDNDLKTQRLMSGFGDTAQAIVKDKISSEMANILEKLRGNTAANEQGMISLMKKVDGFANDINALKAGVEKTLHSVNSKITELKEKNDQSGDELVNFRAEMEATNRRMQSTLTESQHAYKEINDSMEQFRHSLQERMDDMGHKIENNQKAMNKLIEETTESESVLKESMEETKGTLDSFRAMYQLDADDNKVFKKETNDVLHLLQINQESADVFMNHLKEANTVHRLSDLEKKFKYSDELLQTVEKDLKETIAHVGSSAKAIEEISNTLMEHGLKHETEDAKFKAIDKEMKDVKEFNKRLFGALNETQSQLDDLSSVRDEVTVVREIATGSEQMVRLQQSTVQQLLEKTEHRERAHNELDATIKGNDDKAMKKINDLYRDMMNTVLEKQRETIDKMQQMQENLEIIVNSGPRSPGLKRQNSLTSGGSMSKEEVEALLNENAIFVAELCINYEETAVRKNAVPELSDMLVENLALRALEVAQSVTSAADCEAIKYLLRGRSDEIVYDDVIAETRKKLIQDFCRKVMEHLEEAKAKPGIIRSEARDRFLKLLTKALDVGLSKFDQVTIPGSTRLGRLKIPSCIACDRPLVNKVRQDTPILDDMLSNMNRGSSPNNTQALSQTLPPASASSVSNNKSKASLPVRLPAPRTEPVRLDTLPKSKFEAAVPTELDAYVMRGGFRMPKVKTQSAPSKDMLMQASRSGNL